MMVREEFRKMLALKMTLGNADLSCLARIRKLVLN